ncbi:MULTISPECIES: DCC1-like thiol-disulfide oxidoreductase family protein [Asticcacaulis]|uniref:DCC1-like thiol-disulfide oxidoreductase family protein n=1 Tax=Asticcacaulis TaxID=76890 RepID=UPI001AE9B636|nr:MULTISPECIES: DCC1-like thiol-disulfide oxidoreductase family protein [Asticcacaulis]MBP2159610.1 putative DCC family thiol-disulfide oxidoreductase YuxK [Asticcacaulis solisilvae]MDR6800563.1 putative DCC family thiol-disulfide oxidoreductase YuxK [Asticcacaulis sp. BE141]
MSNPPATLWLVYDGDCPFCSATAQMYRLKKSVGDLHVVNAREAGDTEIMQAITAANLDLNEGIIASFNSRLYHGAEALHLLAMLGSDNDWLNRLNVLLFRNPQTVRLAYPAMKFLRNSILKMMGRTPI